jgi:hypothetical protein
MCPADVVDHFARACNWDPLKKQPPSKPKADTTPKAKKKAVKAEEDKEEVSGWQFWDKFKTYKELEELLPDIVNKENLENTLKKLKGGKKLGKPKIKVGLSARPGIMAEEFDSYPEPLRSWITRVRNAVRNTETVVLMEEEYDKHWVAIQGVEDRTFHSFHRVNVFKSNAFENLEQKEKCFTAAHVHLPESLGQEGSKEGSLSTNVSRLLQGLIDATTKTSLTLKVTLLLSLFIL